MYNIIHGNAPSYLNEMFKTKSQIHTHNTRNNKSLYLPKYNLVTGQRTFKFRDIKLWENIFGINLMCFPNDASSIWKKSYISVILSPHIFGAQSGERASTGSSWRGRVRPVPLTRWNPPLHSVGPSSLTCAYVNLILPSFFFNVSGF